MSAEYGPLLEESDGGRVEIETAADALHGMLAPIAGLTEECVIHADGDGFCVDAVDPANVGVIQATADAEAFDSFEVHGSEHVAIGCRLEAVLDLLTNAEDEPTAAGVSVTMDSTATRVRFDWTHGGGIGFRVAKETANLKADKVREYDDGGIPENAWRAELPVKAFVDAVRRADERANHVTFREDGGDLVVRAVGADAVAGARTVFDGVAERTEVDVDYDVESAQSLMSLDYLRLMADGIEASGANVVEVAWGAHHPLRVSWRRSLTAEKKGYAADYWQAPRVNDGGGPQ